MSILTNNTGFTPKNKAKEEYKKKSALYRLCYTEDGDFSITRITMSITFIVALGIVPAGILLHAIWKINIPKDIYNLGMELGTYHA